MPLGTSESLLFRQQYSSYLRGGSSSEEERDRVVVLRLAETQFLSFTFLVT